MTADLNLPTNNDFNGNEKWFALSNSQKRQAKKYGVDVNDEFTKNTFTKKETTKLNTDFNDTLLNSPRLSDQ